MSEPEGLRPDEQHEPQRGDVYESTHGNVYQTLYADEQIVLLRDKQLGRDGTNIHRMEPRSSFSMEYQPDRELGLLGESETDWSEVPWIGESTAENLQDEGYALPVDVEQATDAELLEVVDGLGEKGLKNLRSFTQ